MGRNRNQAGCLSITNSGEYQANWYEYVGDRHSGNQQRHHHTMVLGKGITKAEAERRLAEIVRSVNKSNAGFDELIIRVRWLFQLWDHDLDVAAKSYCLRRIRDKEPELFNAIAKETEELPF